MGYIESLQAAIKRLHGCDAEYLESVAVHEVFQGKTVWDGTVEVFTIEGHPKAKKCYAWAHKEGDGDKETRYVTVLEIPPVNSPKTAVQASVVEAVRKLN